MHTWPQIVFLIIVLLGLGVDLARHGERQTEVKKYNFWTSLISVLISCSLLYAGGFWDVLLK
jgi:hypothetical protein